MTFANVGHQIEVGHFAFIELEVLVLEARIGVVEAEVQLMHERALELRSFLSKFFPSRRRHTRPDRDWSSDVCSSDLDRRRRRSGKTNAATPTITTHTTPARTPSASHVAKSVERMLQASISVTRPMTSRIAGTGERSEERRVGKECRSRWSPDH